MKTIRKWLLELLVEYVVLRLITSPFMAYGLSWLVDSWKKGTAVAFDSLPAWFWPILATLVVLFTFYPAFIAPIVKSRKERLEACRAKVEKAYTCVSQAYKPEILNPEHPGNPDYIRECAQNAVDVLRSQFQKRWSGPNVPDVIDVDNRDSLRQWYDFLRNERTRS
jgi:hypothetical protein